MADRELSVLSSRELDVLRLLADGRTNQKVADGLYVSPRTVASHIDHIISKLDVRSRAAAIADAIRTVWVLWGDPGISSRASSATGAS